MARKTNNKPHISQRQLRNAKGRFAKKLQPADDLNKRSVPHVHTFQSLIQSAGRDLYLNPDEAVRRSRIDTQRMRLDLSVSAPLEERQRAVALLDWHVEPEDKEDAAQKLIAERITRILNQIPHFTKMRMALLDAIWTGRTAVNVVYGWQETPGGRNLVITEWVPIHGDKLTFDAEGNVGVRVGGRLGPEFKTETTPEGRVHWFDERTRLLYVVHRHFIEDGFHEDVRSAGSIHGLGIRHRCYWAWWLKQEALGWVLDHLERWGTGVQVWYYEAGNPESEAQVRDAAEKQSGKHHLLVPRSIGDDKQGSGIEHVELSGRGIDHIRTILQEYFDAQIKNYIIGQTLSSEPAGGGIGEGTAQLHRETKSDVVRLDAINLSETLTNQLVEPLVRFNFPNDECRVRFVIDTDSPDPMGLLEAAQKFWLLGGKVDEDDLRGELGLPKPAEGAAILQKPDITPPPITEPEAD